MSVSCSLLIRMIFLNGTFLSLKCLNSPRNVCNSDSNTIRRNGTWSWKQSRTCSWSYSRPSRVRPTILRLTRSRTCSMMCGIWIWQLRWTSIRMGIQFRCDLTSRPHRPWTLGGRADRNWERGHLLATYWKKKVRRSTFKLSIHLKVWNLRKYLVDCQTT